MTILRRRFLLEPGESLLLSHSALAVAARFDQLADASGLAPEDIFSDPLLSTPLPIARKNEDGQIIRWPNVHADFLWHPVMWLPEDSALRFQVDDGEGEPRIESDHEWAIRIGLELESRGLYDPDSGGWLDVLALHGLDIDNPVDFARVQVWLDGGDDPILDAINLADLDDDPDTEWSFRAAQALVDMLVPAQWHLTATSLAALLEVEQPGLGVIVSELAWEMLADIPDDSDTGNLEPQLIEVHDALVAGGDNGKLNSLLAQVRDTYSYAFDDLEAELLNVSA